MAKQISRRLVSVLLVLILLVGMIPISTLTTQAFTYDLEIGRLEFTLYNSSDYAGIESYESDSPNGKNYLKLHVAPDKSNVQFCIENTGFYPGVASFAIETEGSGKLTYSAQSNAKVTKVAGTSYYNIYLPSYDTGNGRVTFTINTTDYTEDKTGRDYVVTFSDCNLIRTYNYSAGEDIDYSFVTLQPSDGGSYTASSSTYATASPITGSYSEEMFWSVSDGPITLSATADSGKTFVCFVDDENYIVPASYYPIQADTEVTVHPLFLDSTTPAFQVGRKVFTDLTAAIAYATTSDADILVLKNGTVPAGNYTIPDGTTLLVPFSNDYIGYTSHPEVLYSHTTPSAFRTLTLASGANITVADGGAISVSSKISGQSTQYNGTPTGKHGRIKMNPGSSITVQSGGSLYAWGYIYGSGAITAQSGATVHEPLQFVDWRGGSASSGMLSGVFPMNQYYLQNIEVPLTIHAGAVEKVYTSVNMNGGSIPSGATFIGDDGMFSISSGYLVKDYDETRDRLVVDVYGDVSLNSLSIDLKMSFLVNNGVISTDNYTAFPITNNLTLNLKSGSSTLNTRVALLPGVEMTIDAGASLTATKKLVVYDSAQWGNYAASSATYVRIPYSVANGTTAVRAEADAVKDVVLDVNGTLNIATPNFYTTTGGADIKSSNGTGAIAYTQAQEEPLSTTNSKPSATDYAKREHQVTQSGTEVYYRGISMTAAKLHNANGTYTATTGAAAGDAYVYYNGKWTKANIVRWYDGGTLVGWTDSASEPYTFDSSVNGYAPTWDTEDYLPVWQEPVSESGNPYIQNIQLDHLAAPFVITWKDGNGATLKVDKVAADVTPEYTGVTPTKTATVDTTYTFNGTWSPEIVPAAADATYTAQFDSSTRQYTVTWKDGNGNTLKTEQVAYGATPAYSGSTPTKTSTAQYKYTFNNTWSPAITAVTGDATYTAQFNQTVQTYSIMWKDGNGRVLKREALTYGAQPTYTGSTPTKTSTASTVYTFNGKWASGSTVYNSAADVPTVTGTATYTAQFDSSARPYTITWKLDADTVIDTTTVDYGTVPTHDDPVKESTDQYVYTFTGWDSELTAVTGAKTYTATFSESLREYTVIFENYDGTVLQSSTVAYGTTPEYTGSTPSRAADAQYTYSFAGFGTAPVTGDVTYTAQYTSTVNNYTITWKNYDGSILETDADLPYGTLPSFDDATPSKPQTEDYVYIFEGWSIDGSTVISPLPILSADVTYIAVFREREKEWCTVNWEVNGTIVQTDRVRSGEIPHYDGTTPTKAADAQYTYTFDGWTIDGVNVIAPQNLPEVTDDVTYIAHYSTVTNTYTVTWKNGDATIETDTNVPYGTLPTYDGETPTKEPTAQYTFTFNGWDPEVAAITGNTVYNAAYDQTVRNYTITWAMPLNGDDSASVGITQVAVDAVIANHSNAIYSAAKAEAEAQSIPGILDLWAIGGPDGNVKEYLENTYSFDYDSSVCGYIANRICGIEENNSSYSSAADSAWDTVKDSIADEMTAKMRSILTEAEVTSLTPAPESEPDDSPLVTIPVTKADVDAVIANHSNAIYSAAKAAVDELSSWMGFDLWAFGGPVENVDDYLKETYSLSEESESSVRKYIANRICGIEENNSSYSSAADSAWDSVKDSIVDLMIEKLSILTEEDITRLTPIVITHTEASEGTVDSILYRNAQRIYDETRAADRGNFDDVNYIAMGYSHEESMRNYLGNHYGISVAERTYIANLVCGWIDGKMVNFAAADTQWADIKGTISDTLITASGLLSTEDKLALVADEGPAYRVICTDELPYGEAPAYTGGTPLKTGDKENGYSFSGWSTDGSTVISPLPTVSGDVTYLVVFSAAPTSYTVRWSMLREPFTDEEIYDAVQDVIYAHAQEIYDRSYNALPGVDTETMININLNIAGMRENNQEYVKDYIFFYCENDTSSKASADALWDSVKDGIIDALCNTNFITKKETDTLRFYQQIPSTVIDTSTVPYGGTPSYDGTPTKDTDAQYSYTFRAWSADGETELDSFPAVDGADFPNTYITYYAMFDATPVPYTVVWMNGETAVVTDTELTYGDVPSFDGTEPTKEADAQYTYTFAGWSTDGETVLESYPAVGDTFPNTTVTYQAVFTPTLRSYDVTWQAPDGVSNLKVDTDVDYGTVPAYVGAEPTMASTAQYHYEFVGWSTDGATILDPLPEVTGDVTFVPVFVPIVREYNITWMNGETELSVDSVAYGETPAYTGATPAKDGTAQTVYTFAGWTPNVLPVTEDATYTAVFDESERTFTVVWQTEIETKECDENVAYGAAPSYDGSALTRTNAVFLGWEYSYTPFGASEPVTGIVKTGEEFPNVEADVTFTAYFKALSTNPNADETDVFYRHSLSANAEVGVNFYLDIEPYVVEGMDYNDMHVTYSWGSSGQSFSTTEDVVINPNNGLFESSVPVAAKEMNDTITAVLYGDDGSKIATHTYKATDYLHAIIDADAAQPSEEEERTYDKELVDLCKSMLIYGAMAQKEFGYNTANLCVTDEEKNEWIAADSSLMPQYTLSSDYSQYDIQYDANYSEIYSADLNSDGFYDYYGLSLTLKSELEFNVIFRNSSGMPLTATAWDRNDPSKTYTVVRTVRDGIATGNSDGIGDYVSYDILGIPAAKLSSDFVIDFGNNMKYFVNPSCYMYTAQYLYEYYSTDYYAAGQGAALEQLHDVVNALYNYNRKAIAYFGNN